MQKYCTATTTVTIREEKTIKIKKENCLKSKKKKKTITNVRQIQLINAVAVASVAIVYWHSPMIWGGNIITVI